MQFMRKTTKKSTDTPGNFARSSERRRDGSKSKVRLPPLRLVPDIEDNPLEQPVLRLKQLVLFIGVSLALCLLWVLIVFILYRIARATL